MAVKTLIINEVLTYAFDRHQSGHYTDLKTRLIEFYDDTSITEAKSVIWEHYKELAPSPTWEANKVRTNRGRSKKEKEVEDILGAITIVDSKFSSSDDLPVTFCAVNLENMPAINRVDANAELDQRVQLLELQMIEIMKDRANSSEASAAPATPAAQAAQAAPATEQPDVTNSDETIDETNGVHGEKTVLGPRANSPRRSGRRQHRPPNNSGKSGNSDKFVPDDSGLVNGNKPNGSADGEPSYKTTLLNNLNDRDKPWKDIHGHKRRSNAIYGKRTGTSLTAGPRQHELFIFRVAVQYTENDVSDYIKNTDSTIRVISTERLTKGDDRAAHSYKTIVQCDNVAAILSPDFWPEKIGCRIFIGKKSVRTVKQ